MAYAVPYDYKGPSRPFSKGRGSARQRQTRDNPARTIANIFGPYSDIDVRGQGQGQGRVGGGERPQGHEGGGGGGGAGGGDSKG